MLFVKETIYRPEGFSTQKESELSPEAYKHFSFLIRKAHFAKAYPSQSGFFVRTAGMTEDGKIWAGGNKEYGYSDAFIHGETAVVSGLRDITSARIEAIAWYREQETGPGDFGRPCGNCRDILLKYCDTDTILLNGNEQAIVYTRLKDFLFDPKEKGNQKDFKINPYYVDLGIRAVRGGTDIYLPQEMKNDLYGAVLVAENGKAWVGSHYSNVGYDSIPAAMVALLNWKSNYPTGSLDDARLKLSKLILFGVGRTPSVFYRDRQAVLEMDEILRRYTKKGALDVQIVNVDPGYYENGRVIEAYVTNSEEWLPGPFSPGAFRMDDVMDAQLQKLIGR